nr:hypothetical protein BaRGS_034721 [Batillaria attramentaria]
MNACRKKPAAPLHPIPVPKKKWSLVGMDIIGPLQVTDRGNQYIVALTDHFTKFPVAKAIPCKSSEEVARFMYETICIFGAFDSLITDQGREFINFALDILTDRFNINHRISSAYHPETNGQRERDNRTLKDTLVKITDNDDWDELLPAALFAYRTSVHKSTQFSPFLALYGEQAKLPFDVTGDANEQDLNEEIMDTMKGIHEEVKNKIGENISRAQKKQKEYYDSRRAYDHGFRIGDKVLIINAARVHRMGGKMAPRFVGPYELFKLLDSNWICKFEKPQTEPNSLQPSTTVLSPYLKFGCLSARTFYYRLLEVYRLNKFHSQPPVSLHGQLLWREMFYTVGAGTPNFDRMEGNPVCRQIPWDTNPEYLAAWKEGRTGYPFIDAIMTQLRQEGWIHHLARHAVACFLTRGDLWISWEEGQKVFEELLLDADWSLNAGNWMWLSASAFFHQYFRVYSPIAFGKKTDKNGDYIKKYLPILRKFPAQYIYEPWKAPRSVQEAAGCVIGRDYPKPIVDHDTISKKNIKRMAEAYASHKEGKDSSEMDEEKYQ